MNGEETESLSGELIYGSYSYGGQVYSLDLQSGKERALSDWPPVWVFSLSRISATRILVSLKEYADPARYKGVKKYDKSKFPDSTNKYWVAVYDLLNGELKIVREGKNAAYSREYEKIRRFADFSGNPVNWETPVFEDFPCRSAPPISRPACSRNCCI